MARKPRPKEGGKWLFVPEKVEANSPEVAAMLEEEKQNEVLQGLAFRHRASGDTQNPFAAVDEFFDYFPGENKIPDGGEWLLVKHPPQRWRLFGKSFNYLTPKPRPIGLKGENE